METTQNNPLVIQERVFPQPEKPRIEARVVVYGEVDINKVRLLQRQVDELIAAADF